MANITTTGTTGYPGVQDTRTALTDGPTGDTIVANHPNGLGAAILAIEAELGTDPAGSAVDLKTRLAVALNNDGTIQSGVIQSGGGASIVYASGVFTVGWSPDGPNFLQNVGIEITPNSPVNNALRVRLVARSGATPTSTSPCRVAFRIATLTGSTPSVAYVVREINGDTQMQLSSGSTLDFTDGELGRFYIGLLDFNGTVECLVSRDARFSEAQLWNTTSEGGAGGADSSDVIYSTTGRTAVPIRYLGYVDIRTPTAGNWTINPINMQLLGPGVKRTGDIVQEVATVMGHVKTGTTVIPDDDTIPLAADGDSYIWATMSATSPVNRTDFTFVIGGAANSGGGFGTIGIIQSASTTYAAATRFRTDAADFTQIGALRFATVTYSTATLGWYGRVGYAAAGTTTVNGLSAARKYGGRLATELIIREMCV